MKGMIFTEFFSMVEEVFSTEVLEKIINSHIINNTDDSNSSSSSSGSNEIVCIDLADILKQYFRD